MFWFFNRKKEVEKFKQEVQDSFNHVRQDFNKVGQWIKHIDGKSANQDKEISDIKEHIFQIQSDLDEIKSFVSVFGQGAGKQVQTGVDKQTGVGVVQTPVQTAVQTAFLDGLTVMERAIVWALLNSEMRLSYEDLAALLGKDKSTIRGQINTIKQKSEGLIEEFSESNGKKRLYIPEKMREIILKSVKVRVKEGKNLSK